MRIVIAFPALLFALLLVYTSLFASTSVIANYKNDEFAQLEMHDPVGGSEKYDTSPSSQNSSLTQSAAIGIHHHHHILSRSVVAAADEEEAVGEAGAVVEGAPAVAQLRAELAGIIAPPTPPPI